jgi:hypothetical protein
VEPSRFNHWQSAANRRATRSRFRRAGSVTVVVFQRPEDEAAQPGAKVRPREWAYRFTYPTSSHRSRALAGFLR